MPTQLRPEDIIKRHSEYLGCVDLLESGKIKVKIADVFDVSGEQIGPKKAEPGTLAISFQRGSKKLIIKGGKLKRLMFDFGLKVSSWKGREIIIWADPEVKVGKERVGGIKMETVPLDMTKPEPANPEQPEPTQ